MQSHSQQQSTTMNHYEPPFEFIASHPNAFQQVITWCASPLASYKLLTPLVKSSKKPRGSRRGAEGDSLWRSIGCALGLLEAKPQTTAALADVLVLCDGGCDVLLTGLETGLATPVEEGRSGEAEAGEGWWVVVASGFMKDSRSRSRKCGSSPSFEGE